MPYVPSKKTDGVSEDRIVLDSMAQPVAKAIAEVAKKYNYKGAFLGEMNFFITRLIQHLPRELMKTGEAESELRYWMQAGIYGVLLDVVLEHKVRVNQAYEMAQIMKSGDCYDTPYYSKPLQVVDKDGNIIGYTYVNMARTEKTLKEDVLSKGVIQLECTDIEKDIPQLKPDK